MPEKILMTKNEVANYLKVSLQTVEKYMRKGLKSHKIDNGNLVRLYKDEVDSWIMKGE